jgi:hypothetical protein
MNNETIEEKIEMTRRVNRITSICNMKELFINMYNKDKLSSVIEEQSNE